MNYLLGIYICKHIYVSVPFLQIHINLFAEITVIGVTLQNPLIFSYNDIIGEVNVNI